MRGRLLAFVVLGACSGGPLAPDAGSDLLPWDADPRCADDLLCMQIAPIDGVTTLPPGRLVVAWLPFTPGPYQIVVDRPWDASPITQVALADVPPPDADHLTTGPCGPSETFSYAQVVVSTDPNGDGVVTSDEIIAGYDSGDTYGIFQEVLTYSRPGCSPKPPDFPDGVRGGVHVLTAAKPYQRIDGVVKDLETCVPNTAACNSLTNPLF
jgi:hypothetical protein